MSGTMAMRIKELLTEKGKSLYWLQAQTEIAYTSLLRYRDHETTGVRFEHISKLCAAFGCDANTLLGIGKIQKIKK